MGTTDTVDFFREREALTWKQFLASGTTADLNTWRAALTALNGELETRVQLLLERGRRHLPAVQTSGKEPSRAE